MLDSKFNKSYFAKQKNPSFRTKRQRGLSSTDKEYRSKRLYLSRHEVIMINKFCDDPDIDFTSLDEYRNKYWYSYPYWSRGSQRCWNEIQQGGTGIMTILIWYHHFFRPGSREYRVKVIIRDLLNYLKKQAVKAKLGHIKQPSIISKRTIAGSLLVWID